MTRRKTGYGATPHPPNWHVSESYQHGRRQLVPGTFLTIKGERGAVFHFVRHVVVEPADRRRKRREWIDVIGGPPGAHKWRSFRPDKIGRVLRGRR